MKNTTRILPIVYLGLFAVSGCLLTFELLLTRLFSVALWYHFGFFAISIALFGLGAGGIYVQLFPDRFSAEPKTILRQLSLFCLAMGVTMLFPAFLLLKAYFPTHLFLDLSGDTYRIFVILFLISAIPFFFGGLTTTLLFKTFAERISQLYFADLVGASAGCLLTYLLLIWFGAPTAILLNAAIACLAGVCFLTGGGFQKARGVGVTTWTLFFSFLALAGYHETTSHLRLKYAKGFNRSEDEFEKWNPISRVAVFNCETKAPVEGIARFIWGVSPHFKGTFPEIKCVDIDAQAGTFLVRFKNDWENVAFAAQDPPGVVHHLKEKSETLIIGAGGGKDVLAALLLGAQHVTAVELNPIIVHDIMLDHYKDYTGALYQHPNVTAVSDEGRSFLSRSQKSYDIIQLAFVDTSAATSAGAYVLAENNLYTVEAFTEYLIHLKEGGIFSVSWVDVPKLYGGTRLVPLGIAALERLGIQDTASHMMVFAYAAQPTWVIQTVLMKQAPFTEEEERKVTALCRTLGFQITHTPRAPQNSFVSKLIRSQNRDALYPSLPVDVSPTTDDRPFFFYQDRLRDLVPSLYKRQIAGLTYGVGLQVLSRTFVIAASLVVLFFIGPMMVLWRKAPKRPFSTLEAFPYLVYFLCLGLGFMFLEIGLLQKFVLFLGHPFYTLSTTLFSVLLFAGIGSWVTQFFTVPSPRILIQRVTGLLVLWVALVLWGLPFLFHRFVGFPTPIKVGMTVFILMPVSFLMGMPFPLGIKALHRRQSGIIPWAWGLNGGASVLGSVLAMIVAMNFGYTVTFLTGLSIYGITLLMVTLRPSF